MMNRLDDSQAHGLLKQVAAGRSAREMGALLHVAHEEAQWDLERAKHAKIPKDPDPKKGTWAPLQDHILDGEGTNHIDIALGLYLKALLLGDTAEAEFKLRALAKACDVRLPSVRQAVVDEIAASGQINEHFPKRLIPPPRPSSDSKGKP